MTTETGHIPQRGVPLKEAWWRFASDDLQAQIRGQFGPVDFSKQPTGLELIQRLSQYTAAKQNQDSAVKQAVELLRGRLARNALRATGLPPPTGRKFERVSIEPAFWDAAEIDTKSDVVTAMGVEYRAVEVHDHAGPIFPGPQTISLVEHRVIKDTTVAPSTDDSAAFEKAQRGRTNNSDEVKRRALELWAESEPFRNMTRKYQAREIRAQIFGEKARDTDNLSGCTTDSMKRWIGEVLPGKRTDDGGPA